MENKFKVITLCGSTRFKKEFMETQRKLAMEGNIVLSLDFFEKSEPNNVALLEDELQRLQEIHNEKIRISDAIFVINVGGYIGDSTRNEIEYAKFLNKEVSYLEDIIRIDAQGSAVNILKLNCPFCKTYYGEETEADVKNSIRLDCKNCHRSIVLEDLIILTDSISTIEEESCELNNDCPKCGKFYDNVSFEAIKNSNSIHCNTCGKTLL